MLLKLYFITVALGMEQQILFHLMSNHNHYSWQTCLELVRYFMKTQACRNKKNSRGATNYEMSATMVRGRRKLFTSNRLKGLEKLNLCRRQVM